MDCCANGLGPCVLPTAGLPQSCPNCGRRGKPVTTLTIKSLVRDHTRVSGEERYWFCRTPECDVVYFGGREEFRKPDVKVRVGLKEREDPVPCVFDYTRADVRRDLEKHGETEIPARIKAEVQAGFCACEVKNLAGTCCLGDINWAIQEAKQALHLVEATAPT